MAENMFDFDSDDTARLLMLIEYPRSESDIVASPSEYTFSWTSTGEISTGHNTIDWMIITLATMPYFWMECLRIVFVYKSYGLVTVNIAATALCKAEESNSMEYKPDAEYKLILIDMAKWRGALTLRIEDIMEMIFVGVTLIFATMGVYWLLKAFFI
jgi:hypothetical protein